MGLQVRYELCDQKNNGHTKKPGNMSDGMAKRVISYRWN